MIAVGIDIGTNSALMAIALVEADGTYHIISDLHEVPRLGELLDKTGTVSDSAHTRADAVMRSFRHEINRICADYPHVSVHAVATSALREARNGQIVRDSLSTTLGWPIHVIDGTTEASMTFMGAVGVTEQPTLVIDIGGGSTEYAFGSHGQILFSTSTDIGVVRLSERYVGSHPIQHSDQQHAREHVRRELDPFLAQLSGVRHVCATAGTPTALAMMDLGIPTYDDAMIDGHVLSRDRVDHFRDQLCSMSLDALHSIPGLDQRRADIVPMGATILSESLHLFRVSSVQVSTRGLRHGALIEAVKHLPLEQS